MEACVVVCRTKKPAERQGKILFIDALYEVARERAQSFLKAEHQQHILGAYQAFVDEPGFAKVATVDEVLGKDGNLSIPRYVHQVQSESDSGGDNSLEAAWVAFDASGREFWLDMDALVEMLEDASAEETSDA